MATVQERDFYTVPEAARELGVSPSTVWRWIDAQRLPAYRVGMRRIRIRKDDLAAMTGLARTGARAASTTRQTYVVPPLPPAALERRRAAVARILADQQGRSIAPQTTADLIRQVREERDERYTAR